MLSGATLLLRDRDAQIERLKYELWVAETNLQKEIESRPKPEPEIKFSKQPLYMSEEQEDVQWQLDNDLISTEAAQALLRDLEFENAEVHLDEDYTYENFHY